MAAPLERVVEADPQCGMAHWARALASLDNPFAWPVILTPQALTDGAAALDAARATGLKSGARARLRRGHSGVLPRPRQAQPPHARAGLRDRTREAGQRNPDDREVAILHALVLSANFDPTDKQYTNQLRAARILEPIFKAMPDHPGAAHYLIHSYDYAPVAEHGLDAARRYSKIAPDASHAQHVPSHIFTRVGLWRDSIELNRASAKSDAERGWNTMHAYDYMVYAHLQLNQDQAARTVMNDALASAKNADHVAAAYAYAAIPARLALERGDWPAAANLELTPSAASGYPWQKYPFAEAVNAFARRVGAAWMKHASRAQAEVKRLRQLRDAMTALKSACWADQIDINAEVVIGLAAVAEGRNDEGIETLRKAAAREDATEKHAVTPGPIVPAREALASVRLELGKTVDALREYEVTLVREPNRLRATLGAAQAAERAGDAAKART